MNAVAADRDTILSLVPHAGAMCLWQAVLAWDARGIRLRSGAHRDPAHPLRGADGRLHAVHLCEYGAQAAAVHGGLRARAAGATARPGMLVALHEVALHCAAIDAEAGDLEGEAELLIDGGAGWQYAFRVTQGSRLLAEGRVAVLPGNDGEPG